MILGKEAAAPRQASTLQSKMRSGFVSIFLWQSGHRDGPLRLGRRPQERVVSRPAGPAAHGIDERLRLADAEAGEEGVGHLDELGVDGRVLFAEDLDVDLVELAVAALLGLVVAEHGPHVVEAQGRGLEVQPVLDDGPGDGRRVFGAEGDGPAPLVDEGVHLLDDDIRGRAGPSFEELGVLDDRGPELAVAVELEGPPDGGLGGLPGADLGREDVLGSLDGGEVLLRRGLFAHFSTKTPSFRTFR